MNLAQLIDPERVQAGLAAEKVRPTRPAPREALGRVTRSANMRPGDARASALLAPQAAALVLEVLEAAGQPLGIDEIEERAALEPHDVQNGLTELRARGRILRQGGEQHRYRLADAAPPAAAEAGVDMDAMHRRDARAAPTVARTRRTRAGTIVGEILAALQAAPSPLTASEISDVLRKSRGTVNRNSVGAMLTGLASRKLIAKARQQRPATWSITDAGRAEIA